MMLLILPLLSFLALFLLLFSHYKSTLSILTSSRLSFVLALLLVFCGMLAMTELLSLFDAITPLSVAIGWGVVTGVLCYMARDKVYASCGSLYELVVLLAPYKGSITLMLLFVLMPLLMAGFYYPVGDGDSLVYHLPRVAHWIQNGNVAHYPTSDMRQLFHQPCAEYGVMHVQLLSGNDYWLFLIQFVAFVGSVIFVSLLARSFRLPPDYQMIAALLSMTIPMGIAQAASTQTDCVASFFLLGFIYFFLELIKDKGMELRNGLYGGMCLGLGLLTKLTVACFAFPFCLWGALIAIRQGKQFFWKTVLLACGVVLVINTPFYTRNYLLTGNPLGDDRLCTMMRNELYTPSSVVSNIIRNTALHTTLPYEGFNSFLYRGIVWLHHHILSIPPDKKELTFEGDTYRVSFFINDTLAGNGILLLFIVLSAVGIFYVRRKRRANDNIVPYIVSVIGGYVVFCMLFKWQPWGSRLHLPWFMAAVPAVVYGLYECAERRNMLSGVRYILFLIPFIIFSVSFLFGFDNVCVRIFFFLLGMTLFFVLFYISSLFRWDSVARFTTPFIIVCLPYVFFNTLKPLLLNTKIVLADRKHNYLRALWDESFAQQYVYGVEYLKKEGLSAIALDSNMEAPLRALVPGVHVTLLQPLAYTKHCYNSKKLQAYDAVLALHDHTVKHFEETAIKEYKVLGEKTHNGNWKLIVFNKPMLGP